MCGVIFCCVLFVHGMQQVFLIKYGKRTKIKQTLIENKQN